MKYYIVYENDNGGECRCPIPYADKAWANKMGHIGKNQSAGWSGFHLEEQ